MTIPLKGIASLEYQRVDLGVHELNSARYFWFMPTKDSAMSMLYVDRLILIREW